MSKIVEILENRSLPEALSGCMIWTGSVGSHGYGDFRLNKRHYLAHRAAWEEENGQIPQGMFVMHRCDNRMCVNPNHLMLGSHAENMKDKVAKGRQKAGFCRRKLVAQEVLDIREKRLAGASLKELAKMYDRHPDHIRKITNAKIWQ